MYRAMEFFNCAAFWHSAPETVAKAAFRFGGSVFAEGAHMKERPSVLIL